MTGVDVAEQTGISTFEPLTLIAMAAVLRARRGRKAQSEIESVLDRAQALSDQIEQQIGQPGIREERAALARLVGGNAERLARQLSS